MPTDIKLNKVNLSKIIQSGVCLGASLSKFASTLMKVSAPLAQNVLAPLATMAPVSVIDGAIQNKMRRKVVVRARKGITLVILNEDMDDITAFIRLLKNFDVLFDGVTKTVKHEIKRQVERIIELFKLFGYLGASMLGSKSKKRIK